jgi:hypothetical protein
MLDEKTIEYFAGRYLFLDKHYMPQFLWLFNLSRFADKDCLFQLRHISELSTLTSNHENKAMDRKSIDNFKNIDAYIRLDNILYSLIGQNITWEQLINLFIEKENALYKHVFREKKFNVLC